MPREIFVSTACLAKGYPKFKDLLEALITAGFSRIELGHGPPLEGMKIPDEIRGRSGKFFIHNYFPPPIEPFVLNLASQDPDILRRSLHLAETAIRISAELGADFYSVHSGFRGAFTADRLGKELKFRGIADYETAYRTFALSIEQLLRVSEAHNMGLLVEPNVVAPFNLVGGLNELLMMARPDELQRLVGEFAGSALGILLDLGHLKVSSTTLGFTTDDFLDAIGNSIGAFHLHDNDGTADQHRPATAGSWALDVLLREELAGLPIVIESHFSDLGSLVDYFTWLTNILRAS